MKIRSFLNRAFAEAYTRNRGVHAGQIEDVDRRVLASFMGRKLAQRSRGVLARRKSCYIGKNVSMTSTHLISLGANCSIADGVEINGFSAKGVRLGKSVTIDRGAILRGSGVIRNRGVGILIGDYTAVGAFNVILGQGGISIGRECLLGPNVTIVSENHIFADANIPVRAQGESRAAVEIGSDVWIGAGATILSGVKIGDAAVVAAGAVATSDVDPGAIVAGVPAKVVGFRGEG